MTTRVPIVDFIIANPLYRRATVTVYEADANGVKTSTLATLYASPTGTLQLTNPQTLDAYGKFEAPVYVESNVIATVSAVGSIAAHDTAVLTSALTPDPEDSVKVDDSGALGDGTTNDTTAIQTAFNAAIEKNTAVYYTPGKTYVQGAVDINGPVTVFSHGATIKMPATFAAENQSTSYADVANFEVLHESGLVQFVGLKFDGNEQNQSAVNPTAFAVRRRDVDVAAGDTAGIVFSRCSFVNGNKSQCHFSGKTNAAGLQYASFSECKFLDTRKGIGRDDPASPNALGFTPNHIQVTDRFDIFVDQCVFHFSKTLAATGEYAPEAIVANTAGDAVTLDDGPSCRVSNSTFIKLGRKNQTWDGGLNDGNNGLGAIDFYAYARHCSVTGSTFIGCYNAAVRGKMNSRDTIIDDNTFDGCYANVSIVEGSDLQGSNVIVSNNIGRDCVSAGYRVQGASGVSPGYSDNVVISNNIQDGVNNTVGDTGTVGGITVRYLKNVIIEGNVVNGVAVDSGIRVRDCESIKITDNDVEGSAEHGINVTDTTDRLEVTNNRIKTSTEWGIRLSGTNTNAHFRVQGNDVDGAADYGVRFQTIAASLIFTDNTVRNVSGADQAFRFDEGMNDVIFTGNKTDAATPVLNFAGDIDWTLYKDNSWQTAWRTPQVWLNQTDANNLACWEQPDTKALSDDASVSKKAFIFASVKFDGTGTAGAEEYIVHFFTAAGIQNCYLRRNDPASNTKIAVAWFDTDDTRFILESSDADIGAEGVHILVSFNNETGGKRTLITVPWTTPTTADVQPENGESASNQNIQLATARATNDYVFTIGARGGSGGTLLEPMFGSIQRVAIWQDTAPDIESWGATEFAAFWDTSDTTGKLVDPVKADGKLGGTKLIDLYGTAAELRAGRVNGTLGNLVLNPGARIDDGSSPSGREYVYAYGVHDWAGGAATTDSISVPGLESTDIIQCSLQAVGGSETYVLWTNDAGNDQIDLTLDANGTDTTTKISYIVIRPTT